MARKTLVQRIQELLAEASKDAIGSGWCRECECTYYIYTWRPEHVCYCVDCGDEHRPGQHTYPKEV